MPISSPASATEYPRGKNVWEKILTALETQVDAHNFSTWLRPTRYERLEADKLYVRVPHPTFRDWIEAHYRGLIQAAIAQSDAHIESVVFLADDEAVPLPPGHATTVNGSPVPASELSRPVSSETVTTFNPKYMFSSFVVGSSNQFAHAAASRVATDPGRSYNPLFLYGGAGLGKTHLMQAIGHALRERYPAWRIVYLSAELFTNEMVQSLKDDKMISFHERFRKVDALLVDDVQFLAGKERILEEFFHTFNTLYEKQVQIVLSSDRPPKEIQAEERLTSRFECGLIADVQPPDLETRQAILMKKAEAEHFELPEKVALFIATNIKSNIRELEGSLVRLIAYTSLTGEQINEGMARQVLQDLIENDTKKISIEIIQKAVCNFYNLRMGELKAKDNSKRVVFPRQVAMWLARELTDSSLPEIARAFGDKHHTTVLHSIEKISKLRQVDKDLNRNLNKLLALLE